MDTAKPFNYLDEAGVTMSSKFYGEAISLEAFKDALLNYARAAEQLDVIKKMMFYGREPSSQIIKETLEVRSGETSCFEVGKKLANTEQSGIDVLHAIIGVATEAGEFAELLYTTICGQHFDDTNALEESGDVMWYLAALFRALETNFEHEQRRNIAKLRMRFPNAFTEFDANNRDLLAERMILQSNPEAEAGALKVHPTRPGEFEAKTVNELAKRGLVIEVSGPQACGKSLSARMIRNLIPNAKVIDKEQ